MHLIGNRIRAYRRGRGLSVARLAADIGTSARYIEMIEAGNRTPSLARLYQLAAALGVDVSALVSGDPSDIPGADAPPPARRGVVTLGAAAMV